jgi:polyisoprenoid-binding protein YceI
MKFAGLSLLALVLVAPALARHSGLDASESALRLDGALQVSNASLTVLCPLTVGGSFEAKTGALTGELTLDAGQSGPVTGELTVDLRTLATGIGLRDHHMRERYLEVQRGDSFAAARLDRIRLDDLDHLNPAAKATFSGVLTLHGEERQVTGTADIRRSDPGLRVTATFLLKLTEFEIPNRRYLGVGVRNEIVVAVNFKVASRRDL